MSSALVRFLPILLGAVFLALSEALTPADAPAGSFTLSEQFGVSHPTQIVDFDFSSPINPAQSFLLDSSGTEVPFQQLSNNHIAVATDLPANSSRSWTLYYSRPPA